MSSSLNESLNICEPLEFFSFELTGHRAGDEPGELSGESLKAAQALILCLKVSSVSNGKLFREKRGCESLH